MSFMGFEVIISDLMPDEIPRLKICEHMPWCGPEVRAETNAWLLDRFGTTPVAYMLSGNKLVLGAKNAALIRNIERALTGGGK